MRVNDVISVAGFVLPGSRVDVMVTAVPRGANQHVGPVTRTILSNIKVLSAGKNIQPDASKGQPENVAVVTLLVSPEEAEILTLASSEGKIQLALRNNTDGKESASNGVQAAEIFTGKRTPAEPAKPRLRAAVVRTPAPPAEPPPLPALPQIELIRGDKKTTEIIQAHDR